MYTMCLQRQNTAQLASPSLFFVCGEAFFGTQNKKIAASAGRPQCVYLLHQAFQATRPERELRELLHEVVTDSDWQEDLRFTTARGNTFWGRFSMNRVLVNDRTDLLLVKITDVTQTITHAKELEEAKDLAEAAVDVRTRFSANMSHEIRTPMNGVIGMTSLLRETDMTPQQENFLETIRNSGESLLTIITEILDFSKLDASQV